MGCVWRPLPAQDSKDGPVSEKVQKAYQEDLKDVQERRQDRALEEFKKADKQDGGQHIRDADGPGQNFPTTSRQRDKTQ